MNLPPLPDVHNVLALHEVGEQIEESDEVGELRSDDKISDFIVFMVIDSARLF